jgi:hypothetical protein
MLVYFLLLDRPAFLTWAPQQSGQLQAFAAQRDKDTRLGNLLSEVRTYLPDMKREGGVRKSDSMCHPTTLAHLRRRFCPLLSNMLRNDSLTDMEERSVLYFELFEWLKVIQFLLEPSICADLCFRLLPITNPLQV